ncbi:MAG TPA: hypothetical protein VGN26_09260 [Armatimonadota bacterium]
MKHSFSLLAALAVVASPGFAQTKGDPSGDGLVGELNDAFLARQIAIGKRPMDARADVTPINPTTGVIGDGEVNVLDVLVFLQGLVGLLAPDLTVSKHDVGAPIIVTVAATGTNLTATVANAAAGEVTGINWTVDATAGAAGVTVTSTGALTATVHNTGAAPVNATITATPTGPGVANRPRTTAGVITLSVPHDQGG